MQTECMLAFSNASYFVASCLLQEFAKMLTLLPGEQVLDVGSSIGGSAFHMAQVTPLSSCSASVSQSAVH